MVKLARLKRQMALVEWDWNDSTVVSLKFLEFINEEGENNDLY